MKQEKSAYREAGVDIDAAAALVENIKPHIKKTNRTGVMSGIGGFGALFDLKQTGYKDPVLVSGTDGVGTKIKIAIDADIHNTIGIDAVAMCVNDIVVQGAEPLFFLDYFATGKLENHVAEAVIASVAEGCTQAGCALIGGETAEMPGLYAAGDYDLAGFSVGAVERESIISADNVREGDILLGLASSGLHSNGFSLVRHIIAKGGHDYHAPAPFATGQSLQEALLTPTKIYVKSILKALGIKQSDSKSAIHAMAHITGGGFVENVPRALPDNLQAVIDCSAWELPPVFQWLKANGDLSPMDLATTLNAGIGMIIICDKNSKTELIKSFQQSGETVFEIGHIAGRNNDDAIILENLETAWG